MRISKENVIYSMDKNDEAVARVKSGSEVIFEVKDCFSDTIQTEEDVISEIDFNQVNPATGPLYVEGAEVGDVLKVTINKIKPNDFGVVVSAPGLNKYFDQSIQEEQTVICSIDDEAGTFTFQGVEFPMNKMIGVIGTANADEGITTGTPGPHGGNMDNTAIEEGSIVYLPVNTQGALLAIGDMHASMGDGEVWGCGVEVGGEAHVTVEVIKDFKHQVPLVETEDAFHSYGFGKTIDEASQMANDHMIQLLMNRADLTYNQAGMLMTIKGNLTTCQTVNPDVSMRMEMKKDYIERAKGFEQ
ncbi:acetamidase/formamidase family protein [Aerococcaceae bacterium WGS1372]